MNQSDKVDDLYSAIAEVQSKITTLEKNRSAYKYNYADLDSVMAMLRPLLYKNGLGMIQSVTCLADGSAGLLTRIFTKSGQYLEDTLKLPSVKGGANEAQGAGMSITYMRRYAISSFFGITSDDDTDGVADTGKGPMCDQFSSQSSKLKGGESTDAEKKEISALAGAKFPNGASVFSTTEIKNFLSSRTEKAAFEVITDIKKALSERIGGVTKPMESNNNGFDR
jgi:hypothetical protein